MMTLHCDTGHHCATSPQLSGVLRTEFVCFHVLNYTLALTRWLATGPQSANTPRPRTQVLCSPSPVSLCKGQRGQACSAELSWPWKQTSSFSPHCDPVLAELNLTAGNSTGTNTGSLRLSKLQRTTEETTFAFTK